MMLVKFKRRHRFLQAGQVRDVPDHIGQSLIAAGIVTAVIGAATVKTENKAAAGAKKPAAKKAGAAKATKK